VPLTVPNGFASNGSVTLAPELTHRVTLIPGDGTGPELTEAARRVLEATGVAFDWDVREAGVDVMESTGTAAPEETLASVKENRVALKGPITRRSARASSVNVALRHELGLYACLRPCKTYAGVRSRYDGVDLVIVRENTEDLYAGIEYQAGSDDAERVIAELNQLQARQIAPAQGLSIKPISRAGSERIIRFAFDYARAHGRTRVSCVTKANIMKFTDGLFLDTFPRGGRRVPRDRAVGEPGGCGLHGPRPAAGGVRRAGAGRICNGRHSPATHGRARRGLGVAPGGNIGPESAVSRRRTAPRRSTRARTRSTRPR